VDWTLVSWAFVAGAAATVNPCGIAMLPAYISYYLGQDAGRPRFGRGLKAGLLLSVGTFAVFTAMGLVISAVGTAVVSYVPWLVLAVAGLLLVAGVATLLGRAPSLNVAGSRGAPVAGSPGSYVGFGVGYGLASLGCTLPIFMIVVSSVFSAAFFDGLLAFTAYGLGMGLVLTAVSIAAALGKGAVLRWLRAAGPALQYIGGIGLLVAASYLIYYNLRGFEAFYGSGREDWPLYIGISVFLLSFVVTVFVKFLNRARRRPSRT
jgi:cytochrome c-type biogenesis protein